MPGTLTAQDYVLKKKNNEVINVKCPICSPSTTVTKKRAAVKNPAEPVKKRVRTQPDPGPVEREPQTRPRAVVPISRQEPLTQLPISEVPTRPSAIVLNSHQVARVAVVPTSTSLDSAGRQTFPPFNDWPDYQVDWSMWSSHPSSHHRTASNSLPTGVLGMIYQSRFARNLWN